MRLINNHYTQVTSFSLLGTPIALAESFAVIHQLCCEIFHDVCLFTSRKRYKCVVSVCMKDKLHPAGKLSKANADDGHNAGVKILIKI